MLTWGKVFTSRESFHLPGRFSSGEYSHLREALTWGRLPPVMGENSHLGMDLRGGNLTWREALPCRERLHLSGKF